MSYRGNEISPEINIDNVLRDFSFVEMTLLKKIKKWKKKTSTILIVALIATINFHSCKKD